LQRAAEVYRREYAGKNEEELTPRS